VQREDSCNPFDHRIWNETPGAQLIAQRSQLGILSPLLGRTAPQIPLRPCLVSLPGPMRIEALAALCAVLDPPGLLSRVIAPAESFQQTPRTFRQPMAPAQTLPQRCHIKQVRIRRVDAGRLGTVSTGQAGSRVIARQPNSASVRPGGLVVAGSNLVKPDIVKPDTVSPTKSSQVRRSFGEIHSRLQRSSIFTTIAAVAGSLENRQAGFF